MDSTRVREELARGSSRSIISLVDALIGDAVARRASDIHLIQGHDAVRVRLRVDGMLHDTDVLPKDVRPEVISRIKILAGLRTDEHQAAQDGRFRTIGEHGAVDVRVAIIPTHYGENAVLRLLADTAEEFVLATLGLRPRDQATVERSLRRPYGMILATGPTGSGKTTTLYTLVKMLNTNETSVITIEDPIEYAVAGISQIQVTPRTGLTFANGLRSILRQDPNVIMVGEIRDAETAALATNIALTGHRVLSTLHTNDAATTLLRLLDLGVEPYLVASTVNVAIGQRLVRKVCDQCAVRGDVAPSDVERLASVLPPELLAAAATLVRGRGCDRCHQSGYYGRIGIHEVLVVDDAIREAVLRKSSAGDIQRLAVEHGMTTLAQDGFEKVLAGVTTVEEVIRVLHE